MTIDEIVLKALESGPVTVNDIVTRFTGPVRSKLEKLRRHRAVLRDGKGGAHREFTYTLLHPNRAADAERWPFTRGERNAALTSACVGAGRVGRASAPAFILKKRQ